MIGIFAILLCVLFYFLGFLFIETIALAAYVSLFPAILLWEKRKRDNTQIDSSRLSEDERWSKTKMKLDKLEQHIEKEKDATAKQALLNEKRSLETELRELEWKIRESEMTQMYNASKGNMRKIDSNQSVITSMNALDALYKKQQANKNRLLKILKDVEDIMKNEPQSSRNISLLLIANDLKAQYNVYKRKSAKGSATNRNSESFNTMISDYWVCWVVINSLAEGLAVEKNVVKYASPDLQHELSKFLKSVNSQQSSSPEKDCF